MFKRALGHFCFPGLYCFESVSLVTFDDVQNLAADADLNGKLNVKDATTVQKFVAGMPVGTPLGEKRVK